MLKERCNNFIEYCERLKKYQLVAQMYEKISDKGLICEEDFFNPLSIEDIYGTMIEKPNCEINEAMINKFIEQEGLNKVFCQKIKKSNDLRYLIAIGFHDVPIIEACFKENEFKMLISTKNYDYKPKEAEESVEMCFSEAIIKSIKIRGELKLKELYLDRQEIYCLGEGQNLYIFEFNDRGEGDSVEIQIISNECALVY